MKKILVITPFFHPHIGGSEKYIEGLYAFLKAKNPDISVDVLCYNTNNAKQKESYRGLNIIRIPCFKLLTDQFYVPNPFSVIKFLYKNGRSYDLIHCSTRFFDSSWWSPLYAKIAGKKVILTDHCAGHPVHKNGLVSSISKAVDLTIVNLFIHFYDAVFSENKENQRFLKKVFGINSKLAYPGLDFNSSPKKRGNGKLKVIFVGRLIESKGVKNLFDIASKKPEIDFIFAGSGPLLAPLKKEIKSRKLINIYLEGVLPRNKVMELLKKSDIFAYPSWHSEGLPMSIIEAGVAGLAVIASDAGGIKEVIVNNKTGLLVSNTEDFERNLDLLIANGELREKLGKNLKESVVKKFNWGNSAREIEDLL